MRALLPWIAGCLLGVLPQVAPAEVAAAIQALENCGNSAPASASGLDKLSPACPQVVEQAVLELHLDRQLAADWRERITGPNLLELARLAKRYQGEPPGTAPQPTTLPSIAQQLHDEPAPISRWQRFKSWLRSLLQQRPEQSDDNWLSRLRLPWRPSELLARLIGYGCAAAVLALALWIVLREVRAVHLPIPARARRARGVMPPPADRDSDQLPDLAALTVQQRPAALLAALVAALRHSGRLGLERALTHRQLGVRARFDDESQRGRFQRLALLAERCLYGTPEPLSAELQADAVTLHQQLLTPWGRPT